MNGTGDRDPNGGTKEEIDDTNAQYSAEAQLQLQQQAQQDMKAEQQLAMTAAAAESDYQYQQQQPVGQDQQQPQQQQPPQQQNFTPLSAAMTQRPDAGCFLRCRGLPYSASENDVRKFFADFTVLDVSFTNSMEGKPTGECYVEFPSRELASKAQLKDRQTMGSRYIEVFQVSDVEMDQLVKRLQVKKNMSTKGFVRIRGLPYTCTKDNVQQFFRGLSVEEVVFGKEPGLEGRPTGEGFAKFSTAEEAERALQLNGQHMGSRYLEIFKSDGAAFEAFKTRAQNNIVPLKALAQAGSGPDPWGAPGGGGYCPPGGGGGYGGGGHGGYGGGGGYGSGYEQRGGGRPMGRGGYQGMGRGGYQDQPSHRYSPYPNYGSYGYGHGGGGDGGHHRGGGGGGGGYRGRGGGRGGGSGGNFGGGGCGGDDGYGDGGGYGGGYHDSSVVGPNKIYMRGIPFRISAADIERFFSPMICVDIQVGTMPDGRSSGDGIVEFQSPADARQALTKDRECIGNRYIELFPTVSAKIPSHVSYESIGGKGGGQRAPAIPTPAQQYAQAVQQQVAAYASGNYPPPPPQQHQYGQYGGADYSTNYYGAYGGGGGGQDGGGGQQPKTDYNWPASQF